MTEIEFAAQWLTREFGPIHPDQSTREALTMRAFSGGSEPPAAAAAARVLQYVIVAEAKAIAAGRDPRGLAPDVAALFPLDDYLAGLFSEYARAARISAAE